MNNYMIDISAWPANARLAIVLIPFALSVVGLAMTTHIAATRHFEVLRAALQNSKGFQDNVRAKGTLTVKFRALIVAGAAVFLLWPDWAIRKGLLDPEDNKNFPDYLRRRIRISFWLETPTFVWLMLVSYFVKIN